MKLGPNTIARNRAQRQIDEALRTYHEEAYEELPKAEVNGGNCHKKLSKRHVVQAVTAMTMYLGLGGGSAGTVDLYELLDVALLHPERHSELNEVLRRARGS